MGYIKIYLSLMNALIPNIEICIFDKQVDNNCDKNQISKYGLSPYFFCCEDGFVIIGIFYQNISQNLISIIYLCLLGITLSLFFFLVFCPFCKTTCFCQGKCISSPKLLEILANEHIIIITNYMKHIKWLHTKKH